MCKFSLSPLKHCECDSPYVYRYLVYVCTSVTANNMQSWLPTHAYSGTLLLRMPAGCKPVSATSYRRSFHLTLPPGGTYVHFIARLPKVLLGLGISWLPGAIKIAHSHLAHHGDVTSKQIYFKMKYFWNCRA